MLLFHQDFPIMFNLDRFPWWSAPKNTINHLFIQTIACVLITPNKQGNDKAVCVIHRTLGSAYVILNWQFSTSYQRCISWESHRSELHKTSLLISQQAVTWTYLDQLIWRRMTSPWGLYFDNSKVKILPSQFSNDEYQSIQILKKIIPRNAGMYAHVISWKKNNIHYYYMTLNNIWISPD